MCYPSQNFQEVIECLQGMIRRFRPARNSPSISGPVLLFKALLLSAALFLCYCTRPTEKPHDLGSSSVPQTQQSIAALDSDSLLSGKKIAALLKQALPKDRVRITMALGRLALPSALLALKELSQDPEGGVREKAIFALRLLALSGQNLRSPFVQEIEHTFFRRLAHETAVTVQSALLESLGWIGSQQATLWLVRGLSHPQTASAALTGALHLARRRELGELDPTLLLPFFKAEDPEKRALAWMLAQAAAPKNGAQILYPWAKAAHADPSPAVRRRVVAALAAFADPVSLRELVSFLQDYDAAVQSAAAKHLTRGGVVVARALMAFVERHWESIIANHFRLTGKELHPVLIALKALEAHAQVRAVGSFAKKFLALTDASNAAVVYDEKEALSVDHLHCAVARLSDFAKKQLRETLRCGKAHSQLFSQKLRKELILRTQLEIKQSFFKNRPLALEEFWEPNRPLPAFVLASLLEAKASASAALITRLIETASPQEAAWGALLWAGKFFKTSLKEISGSVIQRLAKLDLFRYPEAFCVMCHALKHLEVSQLPQELMSRVQRGPFAIKRCVNEAFVTPAKLLYAAPPQAKQAAASRSLAQGALHQKKASETEGPGSKWVTAAEVQSLQTKRAAKEKYAKVVTNRGVLMIELDLEEAPEAVAHFSQLIENKWYQNLPITQVDPFSQIVVGDEPVELPFAFRTCFSCELTPRPFIEGSVGFLAPDSDLASGPLLLTLERQPQRDGRFPHLGQVIRGRELLYQLQPGDVIKNIYLSSSLASEREQ